MQHNFELAIPRRFFFHFIFSPTGPTRPRCQHVGVFHHQSSLTAATMRQNALKLLLFAVRQKKKSQKQTAIIA